MINDVGVTEGLSVGRVVMASQGFRMSESLLAMIRRLLRSTPGELTGLFVEDARLLLAASLPLTREVGRDSGIVRPLETGDLERLMQHRARAFQAQMAVLAKETAQPWTFTKHRGDFAIHALQALEQADLVVVGARGSSAATAHEAGAIVVVMDSGVAGMRVLRAAMRLADKSESRLHVIVVTESSEAFENTKRRIQLIEDSGQINSIVASRGVPAILQGPTASLPGTAVLVLSANLLEGLAASLMSKWAGRLILVSAVH